MKFLRVLFLGLAGLLVIGVAALAITLSYTASCPEQPVLYAGDDGMRSVIHRCYGSPEVLETVVAPRPTPEPDQVLVQVRAAGVNPLDWHYLRGQPYFMRPMSGIGSPHTQQLGRDFAGTVVETGESVTRFKPGDAVFGGADGAFGDYLTVREGGSLAHKPDSVGYAEAAAIPVAAISALQALRDAAQVKPGDRVLINGASGGVGTFAVQLARTMGAEVTGVCSTRNLALVRSLGAAEVIDYTVTDYTRGDERWDVIIDAVGNHGPLANRRALAPGGTLVMVGAGKGNWVGPLARIGLAVAASRFVDEEMTPLMAQLRGEDLAYLAELMDSGKLTPVIDRHYPLEEIDAAIAYSESGRARGKIIVDVNPADG